MQGGLVRFVIHRNVMQFGKGKGRGRGDVQCVRSPIPVMRQGAIVIIIVVRGKVTGGPGSPLLPEGGARAFGRIEGAGLIGGGHRNVGNFGTARAVAYLGFLQGLARSPTRGSSFHTQSNVLVGFPRGKGHSGRLVGVEGKA